MSAMKLDEKALEAFRNALELPRWYSDDELLSAIHAYIESATPPDVADSEEEARIDNLRLRAFQTNAEQDRQAYFEAASKWFQDRHFRRMEAATALRLSAGGGVPEGWKLVPVEPTPEMLGAFWRQKNCGTQEVGDRGPHTDDYSAYRAMLAASPTVEAGHVE